MLVIDFTVDGRQYTKDVTNITLELCGYHVDLMFTTYYFCYHFYVASITSAVEFDQNRSENVDDKSYQHQLVQIQVLTTDL